jgi:hypothetical protein
VFIIDFAMEKLLVRLSSAPVLMKISSFSRMIDFPTAHLSTWILHFETASDLSMLSVSLETFWMSENEK